MKERKDERKMERREWVWSNGLKGRWMEQKEMKKKKSSDVR